MLGKLPVPRRPANLDHSRARASAAFAVGAGGGCLVIFPSSIISLLSPTLFATARYRLKYCLKGPLNPNNQPNKGLFCSYQMAVSSCHLRGCRD